MTNLHKVIYFLATKTIATKQDKKIAIEEIANLLNVTKNNAAVYFTKAIKQLQPTPKAIPKAQEPAPETYVEQMEIINQRIAAIIEKANNAVHSI